MRALFLIVLVVLLPGSVFAQTADWMDLTRSYEKAFPKIPNMDWDAKSGIPTTRKCSGIGGNRQNPDVFFITQSLCIEDTESRDGTELEGKLFVMVYRDESTALRALKSFTAKWDYTLVNENYIEWHAVQSKDEPGGPFHNVMMRDGRVVVHFRLGPDPDSSTAPSIAFMQDVTNRVAGAVLHRVFGGGYVNPETGGVELTDPGQGRLDTVEEAEGSGATSFFYAPAAGTKLNHYAWQTDLAGWSFHASPNDDFVFAVPDDWSFAHQIQGMVLSAEPPADRYWPYTNPPKVRVGVEVLPPDGRSVIDAMNRYFSTLKSFSPDAEIQSHESVVLNGKPGEVAQVAFTHANLKYVVIEITQMHRGQLYRFLLQSPEKAFPETQEVLQTIAQSFILKD